MRPRAALLPALQGSRGGRAEEQTLAAMSPNGVPVSNGLADGVSASTRPGAGVVPGGAASLPLGPSATRAPWSGRARHRSAIGRHRWRGCSGMARAGTAVALCSRSMVLPINHARLVALLRRLAVVAAPLVSVELSGCGACSGAADQIFLLRNPDAETQALIDACRDPMARVCGPLCAKVSGKTYFDHCELHPDRDGYVEVHVGEEARCVGGRRPQHLIVTDIGKAGRALPVGAFFAAQFQLEAASVPAFHALCRELGALGAPAFLSDAAGASARDEVRHARALAVLARRYGAQPRAPRVAAPTPRSRLAFAVENVIEGCVREAYGALLAAVQARRSREPLVRQIMTGGAEDEARHAALAFSVDDWARTRLSSAERREVDAARELAIDDLERHAGDGWSLALDASVGLPPPATARALLGELRRPLWA